MHLIYSAYIHLDYKLLGAGPGQSQVLFIFTISHSFHHPYPRSSHVTSHRIEFHKCMIPKDSICDVPGKRLSTLLQIPVKHILLNSESAILHWKYYF